MSNPCRRPRKGPTDIAFVVAFLALSALAYAAFFSGVSKTIRGSSGLDFTDFYLPGQNPWTGAITEPADAQGRFVSLKAAGRSQR